MSSVVRAPEMASACSSRSRSAKRAANPRLPSRLSGGLGPERRPGEDPQAVARLPDHRGLAPLVADAERELGELGAPPVPGLARRSGPLRTRGPRPERCPGREGQGGRGPASPARPGPGSWRTTRPPGAAPPRTRPPRAPSPDAGHRQEARPSTTRAVPSGSTASWQEPSSSDPRRGHDLDRDGTVRSLRANALPARCVLDADKQLHASLPRMRPPRRRTSAGHVVRHDLGYPTRRGERRIGWASSESGS